jgi:hypothetical protein
MYSRLVVYPERTETPPMTTTRYTVTAYIDVDTHFMGYDPTHRLAEVDTFTVATNEDPRHAAEEMFRIGQKGFDEQHRFQDADGKAYPLDVRSVSVSDLIKVVHDRRTWFFAVASIGFDEIPEPANPIVELAKARSRASTETPR